MITHSARDGFNQLLQEAVKTSLSSSLENCFDMTILADQSAIDEKKIVILTIASLLFRATVMIYFTPDERAKMFFSRISRVPTDEMTEQGLFDAVAEYGNMCCGTLNRNLGQFFQYVGMSTPNFIDRRSSSFLEAQNYGYTAHFQVDAGDDYRFYISLGVCNYAPLDFQVQAQAEDTSTGELELF
ncbi:MAG: hypothetical protein H6R04_1623 [Burkholderiaceae bacterium]|nr:hypothetical protein [Burkholderiaceae bacterium]